jgi:four helix bundle protein
MKDFRQLTVWQRAHRSLEIAMGSAREVEYLLLLAHDLGLLPQPSHETLNAHTDEVKRMLFGLVSKVRVDRQSSRG